MTPGLLIDGWFGQISTVTLPSNVSINFAVIFFRCASIDIPVQLVMAQHPSHIQVF